MARSMKLRLECLGTLIGIEISGWNAGEGIVTEMCKLCKLIEFLIVHYVNNS